MRNRFLLLFFVFVVCLPASAAINVPDSARQEWSAASSFLGSMGIQPQEVEVVYESPQCVYFAAPADSAFVFVAREKYRSVLGSIVLAYGTGEEVWIKSPEEEDPVEQDNFFLRMIEFYEKTLKAIDETGARPVSFPAKEEVLPTLADIYYGQHLPYNKLFPMDGYGDDAWYSVVGCGPVALGQVLTYYKFPVQPKGVYSGHTIHGNPYTYDMDDYPVDWNDLKPEVLLLDCAMTLGTIIGTGASHTKLSQFKAALFDGWGYSPSCKILTAILSETEMVGMIRDDISDGRPVIIAGGNHLFVCDGLKDDFLHFDFGWRGFANGYFRTLVLPSAPEWQLPFDEAMIGVEPDYGHEYKEVTVKLSKAGTLAKKLKEDTRYIRKLTIRGPINGDDIDLIRLMAGAVTIPSDYKNEYGALSELDLTDARIAQTAPFHLRYSMVPIQGTIQPANGPAVEYYFDPDTITEKDWEEIVRLGLDKKYMIEWKDGLIIQRCVTWADAIPTRMFSDCISLSKICLPKKLKRIYAYAFFNCKGLRQVENIPRKDVDPRAFMFSSFTPENSEANTSK